MGFVMKRLVSMDLLGPKKFLHLTSNNLSFSDSIVYFQWSDVKKKQNKNLPLSEQDIAIRWNLYINSIHFSN